LIPKEPTSIHPFKSVSVRMPIMAVCYGGAGIARLLDDSLKAVSLASTSVTVVQDVRLPSGTSATCLCSYNNFAYIGSNKGFIHVFDISKLRIIIALEAFSEAVYSIACDRNNIFAISKSGVLKKWDQEGLTPISKVTSKKFPGGLVTICDGGGLFVATHTAIYWYDTEGTTVRYKFSHEAFSVKHLCVVDRKLIASDQGSRSTGPSLMCWDLMAKTQIKAGVGATIAGIFPCGDTKLLVAFENGSIQIWNTNPLHSERTLSDHMHSAPMSCLYVEKDSQNKISLLSCGNHLKVWTVK